MFHTNTKNGITYLTADTLDGVCHGFSTRPGGVSPAPWYSLNLGVGRGEIWSGCGRITAASAPSWAWT